MDQENYLNVDNIAPVMGKLQLTILNLEAMVRARDETIEDLRREIMTLKVGEEARPYD